MERTTSPHKAVGGAWHGVPLMWHTDLDHGGRWWSLTTDTKEWLWTNPDGAVADERLVVRPGDRFIDAGGGEECFPGVRGIPDHGDAWSREWAGTRLSASVETAYGRLGRTAPAAEGQTLRFDYTIEPNDVVRPDRCGLSAHAHAVHLLLDLSTSARLVVPAAAGMTVLDHPTPGRDAEAVWPTLDGANLSVLGPTDGTSVCAVLRGLATPFAPAEAYVVDGDDLLALRWQADDPALVGLMLWRNLGGWPDGRPYRSIGVEPLVEAMDPMAWWLEVSAYARSE